MAFKEKEKSQDGTEQFRCREGTLSGEAMPLWATCLIIEHQRLTHDFNVRMLIEKQSKKVVDEGNTCKKIALWKHEA